MGKKWVIASLLWGITGLGLLGLGCSSDSEATILGFELSCNSDLDCPFGSFCNPDAECVGFSTLKINEDENCIENYDCPGD